jgi:hypothetical protein
MWIRKSEAEYRGEVLLENILWKSRFSPSIPFLLACGVGLFVTALHVLGLHTQRPATIPSPPTPLNEALLTLPFHILGIFAFLYLARMMGFRFSSKPQVSICASCHSFEGVEPGSRCPCGGRFEESDRWTWLPDEQKPRHPSR